MTSERCVRGNGPNRLQTLWEFADILRIVERLNVLTGAGNGDRIEQLEKIEIQRPKNGRLEYALQAEELTRR